MRDQFLAGPGRVLIFRNSQLIGIANAMQDTGINISNAVEEVRGGVGNPVWGKYFHDSNMGVTLTNALFDLELMAANLGVNVEKGAVTLYEEQVTAGKMGKLDLTNAAVSFDGTVIGWYKKPADIEWKIGNVSDKVLTAPGAQVGEVYCVKYFYQNENADFIKIKTQYIPAELHIVIINDLFRGGIDNQAMTEKYGRLITDIPRLQLDGNIDLSLTASGAATMPLSGSALAVSDRTVCSAEPYYGTMTQEIFGAKWQDDVVAIAVENGDVELEQSGSETLAVRVIFSGSKPAVRKPNSAFTFAVEDTPASTASGTAVGEHDGVITASTTGGNAIVSVKLTDAPNIAPQFVRVTVAG